MQHKDHEIEEMFSIGVLGSAPCHVCKKLKLTKNWIIESVFVRRYFELIRLHISLGKALFVGRPAFLTGLPLCIYFKSFTFAQNYTDTQTHMRHWISRPTARFGCYSFSTSSQKPCDIIVFHWKKKISTWKMCLKQEWRKKIGWTDACQAMTFWFVTLGILPPKPVQSRSFGWCVPALPSGGKQRKRLLSGCRLKFDHTSVQVACLFAIVWHYLILFDCAVLCHQAHMYMRKILPFVEAAEIT